jgi:hypothetical protein
MPYYVSMAERRRLLASLGRPKYATMAERAAALREVDKFKLKLRGLWPKPTGRVMQVRSSGYVIPAVTDWRAAS